MSTQDIEEDSILRQLPVDLHRDIKRYLCLDIVILSNNSNHIFNIISLMKQERYLVVNNTQKM
jgi:hypothetical protein